MMSSSVCKQSSACSDGFRWESIPMPFNALIDLGIPYLDEITLYVS